MRASLDIGRFWDGAALPAASQASVQLGLAATALTVDVDSPSFGDPVPDRPPGPTDRLWEHEVVELFIAGPGDAYLEIELGPGGHHLVLQLSGIRRPVAERLPITYEVARLAGRWRGTALVPRHYLPREPWRVNAYAVHARGCRPGSDRCHHAHAAVPGAAPDFHQPRKFVPVPWRTGT